MGDPDEIAQQLKKNGDRFVTFLTGLDDADWSKQVYADGEQWTLEQLVTHIVETEREIPELIQKVLQGHEGVPEDFSIDEHNKTQVGQVLGIGFAELQRLFKQRREATVKLVAAMSPADLAKRGRHPFLGETEVYEMLRLMALHVQLHMRDIRRVI